MSWLMGHLWVAIIPLAIVAILCYKLIGRFFLGLVVVPEDCIGIVNKKFVLFGSNSRLPDGAIVALNGEAGIQADTLAPGWHLRKWPWQYRVVIEEFTTIKQGMIGVVDARDGKPLSGGRVLGRTVDCNSFQDARAFLTKGGERGSQIAIIPPGTYRINTELFEVREAEVLEIPDNMVGIVTTKDGTALAKGEIAGRDVPGHNMFQDGQVFIDGGGFKGLQEQVMLAGRYFLNPRFATVELKPMTEVPIASVGVVISYVGAEGKDVTGDEFKHGNLVSRGEKGVWFEPLDPGKYPINPYTHRVEVVPTANVVLNWATGKTESHKLDERLSSITVRSSDGFSFNLDVSQIIHIPRNNAPKVIARFGSVANLVTQVLEPTIGNYFRNAAQASDVIDFLHKRSDRQEEARASIKDALDEYNVGAVNTLIGDIVPPEALMRTLTDRKIAEQERVTYKTQMEAETVRKELEQAKAIADTQARVVDAERTVTIAAFNAEAAVKKAGGDAQSKTINAEADAKVLQMVGDAEGKKITAVGSAEADVIRLKTVAIGQDNYAKIEVSRSLAASGQRLVPDVQVNGSGATSGSGGGVMDAFVALMVRDELKKDAAEKTTPPPATPPTDVAAA